MDRKSKVLGLLDPCDPRTNFHSLNTNFWALTINPNKSPSPYSRQSSGACRGHRKEWSFTTQLSGQSVGKSSNLSSLPPMLQRRKMSCGRHWASGTGGKPLLQTEKQRQCLIVISQEEDEASTHFTLKQILPHATPRGERTCFRSKATDRRMRQTRTVRHGERVTAKCEDTWPWQW